MNDGFNNLMKATVEVVDTARRLKAAFAEAGMWIDDDRVAQLAVEVVAMARDAGPEPVMVPEGSVDAGRGEAV